MYSQNCGQHLIIEILRISQYICLHIQSRQNVKTSVTAADNLFHFSKENFSVGMVSIFKFNHWLQSTALMFSRCGFYFAFSLELDASFSLLQVQRWSSGTSFITSSTCFPHPTKRQKTYHPTMGSPQLGQYSLILQLFTISFKTLILHSWVPPNPKTIDGSFIFSSVMSTSQFGLCKSNFKILIQLQNFYISF